MKTAEQIKARIEELSAKLEIDRKRSVASQIGVQREEAEKRVRRLEGNIGALEWVLRAEPPAAI